MYRSKKNAVKIIERIVRKVISENDDSQLINLIAKNLWPNNTLDQLAKKREVDAFIKQYFPNKSYQFVYDELESENDNPEPYRL